jgi:hypothetical protein
MPLDKWSVTSDLREEIEECVDTLPQLRLDLLAGAFENVHRHARRISIFQLDRRLAYFRNFVGGQKP